MFIFPAATAPDSCLYCSLLVDGWSTGGSQGRRKGEEEAAAVLVVSVGTGGELGDEAAVATNREDKWMALTLLGSQRAGHGPRLQSHIPSSDFPLHPPLCVYFVSSHFPLCLPPSLLLIWFDWQRNAAQLKVAAEEQWGIVLFPACTHTLVHALALTHQRHVGKHRYI